MGADEISSVQKKGVQTVSDIQDFIDLGDVVRDKDLEDAINIALKCIAKPDVPPAEAKKAMVKLQGYAFIFKMKGLVYMQIHKGQALTRENIRKNSYLYASEQCDKLAGTLKYLIRNNSI